MCAFSKKKSCYRGKFQLSKVHRHDDLRSGLCIREYGLYLLSRLILDLIRLRMLALPTSSARLDSRAFYRS